jgi:hypothetical protein
MSENNKGAVMMTFFIAGFVCFVCAISIYLRREDTQWQRTVKLISDIGATYKDDKFKTDNTLQTIIQQIDTTRAQATSQIVEVRIAHETEVARMKSELTEVSAHLAHLRKENHKTQILLEANAQDKNAELHVLKSAADAVIANVRRAPPVNKKKQKSKPVRARSSH